MQSNKGQLVSQYIEKIDRAMLKECPDIIKEDVKGRHGVYALYSEEDK